MSTSRLTAAGSFLALLAAVLGLSAGAGLGLTSGRPPAAPTAPAPAPEPARPPASDPVEAFLRTAGRTTGANLAATPYLRGVLEQRLGPNLPTATPQQIAAAVRDHVRARCGLRPPADLAGHVRRVNERHRGLGSPRPRPVAGATPDPSAETFDWRNPGVVYSGAGVVSAVKDQGQCGDCWAFSTVATLESAYLLSAGRAISGSEQQLLDCAASVVPGDFGIPYSCNGGWWAWDVYTPHGPGGETEASDPYRGRQAGCAGAGGPYRLASWAYVGESETVPTDAQLKAALCKYGPISVGVTVLDETTWAANAGEFLAEFRNNPGIDVNHAIQLVGWDAGGWYIKNSWGKGWGAHGFAHVKYGCNNVGFGAAYVVAVAPPTPTPTPPGPAPPAAESYSVTGSFTLTPNR